MNIKAIETYNKLKQMLKGELKASYIITPKKAHEVAEKLLEVGGDMSLANEHEDYYITFEGFYIAFYFKGHFRGHHVEMVLINEAAAEQKDSLCSF